MNRKRNRRRGRKRPTAKKKVVNLPPEFSNGIIIFDEDVFYGVYLEILMESLEEKEILKIDSNQAFEKFKQLFPAGKYKNNIYVVDELFGWGEVDIRQLVENLRLVDKDAKVVGATALEDGEIANISIYDKVAVKSKGNHAQSLTKVVAEVMGVEIQFNNNDPEFN